LPPRCDIAAAVSAKAKKQVPPPLFQQRKLVLKHFFKPLERDVPAGLAVDRVAEGHVVGRHGFGDRASRPTDPEEVSSDLLPGTDLCKRSVEPVVEVDSEGFFSHRIDRVGGSLHGEGVPGGESGMRRREAAGGQWLGGPVFLQRCRSRVLSAPANGITSQCLCSISQPASLVRSRPRLTNAGGGDSRWLDF
jgi:hypothetical protein